MFENIFKVITPPKNPIHNIGDWYLIEKKYNLKFPKDYKKIIDNYGSGCFSDCFQFISPFSNESQEFETFIEDNFDFYDPTNIEKLPLYPEKGGLFPFADSNRGESLYWITNGHPDNWSIYLIDHRSDKAFIFNMGCEKFLVKWLKNQLKDIPFSKSQSHYFEPFLSFNSVSIYINYIEISFQKRLKALCLKLKIKEKLFEDIRENAEESSSNAAFLLDDESTKITYSDNSKYGGSISVKFLKENEGQIKEIIRQAITDLKWEVRQITNTDGENLWTDFNCVKTEFYKNIKELTRFDFPSNPVWKIKPNQSKDILVCKVYESDMVEGDSHIVLTDFHDKNFSMHTGYVFYKNTNDQAILNPHFLYNEVWYSVFLEGVVDKNAISKLRPILEKIFPLMYESFEANGLKSISGVINSFCYLDKASGKIKEIEYDFKPPSSSVVPEWVKKKMDGK